MSWNQATENFYVTGERGKQENSSKQMQRLRRRTEQTAYNSNGSRKSNNLKKLWPILKPKGCWPDIYHLTKVLFSTENMALSSFDSANWLKSLQNVYYLVSRDLILCEMKTVVTNQLSTGEQLCKIGVTVCGIT